MSTGIELVRPPALSATAPYAYAAVSDPGRMVFTAGACPLDADGVTVAVGDVVGQTRRVMANLDTALEAAGAELSDVLKTTVYVATADRADLLAAWQVVREAFGEHDADQHAGRRDGSGLPRPARRGGGRRRPRELERAGPAARERRRRRLRSAAGRPAGGRRHPVRLTGYIVNNY